jgi:hypothetical protein
MDPYLVSIMLVCTTLKAPLPNSLPEHSQVTGQTESESEALSLGSTAILDEMDELDTFAPDTPPQYQSCLADECSSEHVPLPAATVTVKGVPELFRST